jgi:hypothetical protein
MMHAMELRYLDFDYSEDAEGNGVFDAMASVSPSQREGVLAEVVAVLAWAHATFPDACAPAEDGGLWHYELRGVQEVSTPEAMDFDEHTGRLNVHAGTPGPARHTVVLSLAGSADFCEGLRSQFAIG